jgi:YbbR domain-containing protein
VRNPKRNPWTGFLQDNFQWMAVSLIIAFGLWIIAVLQSDPVEERDYSRLLTIDYLVDDDFVITSENETQTVLVTIRAPQSIWDSLRPNDIDIQADLRGKTPGTYTVRLEGQLDDDIRGEITAIIPDEIEVSIEQLVSRRVPIRTVVSQEPPSGYTYPTPTCTLSEVTARGPIHRLENAIAVARLNLAEERNPVTLTVNLFAANETNQIIRDVTLETTQVECHVEITQREGVSELSVVPSVEGFPPEGYIYQGFDFEPKTIVVTGQPAAIRELNGVVNTQPIDLSKATGDFARTVSVNLPAGVRLLPDTQTINVTLYIGTIQGSRQYEAIPVEIENRNPNLEVDLLPDKVTVFVVGPQPLLESLNPDDLLVVVDLSGITQPGTYQENAVARLAIGNASSDLQITVQPPEINLTVRELEQPR